MAKVNNHISPRQPPQNPARVSPRQHTIPAPAALTHPAVTTSGSNLGANLNELDYLLQDLNSAQFMRDISRSGSGMCEIYLSWQSAMKCHEARCASEKLRL